MPTLTFTRDDLLASLKLASRRGIVAYYRQTGMLPADADGLLATAVRRSTGTLVSIYDADAAGLECGDDPELRYATVCEPHSRLVLHRTLELAEHHATDPSGWCGVCSGDEPE